MLAEDVFEPRSRQGTVPCIEKEFRLRPRAAHRQPCPECDGCLFPQWQNPFTPAFPSDMYRTVWIQGKLIEPNADQLRNAQTGGKGEVKHRPIPSGVFGSGAFSTACISSCDRYPTSASSVLLVGIP